MSRSALVVLAALALSGPAWSGPLRWAKVSDPKPKLANKGPIEISHVAGGENIAVFFGGARVPTAGVRAWVEALTFWSTPKLPDFAVLLMYAVPGPADYAYPGRTREHNFDQLVASISANANQYGTRLIIFAAHSSGAFVADAALAVLAKKRPDLLPRVVYFKLDGGALEGINAQVAAKLAGVFCAHTSCTGKPTIASMNTTDATTCPKSTGGKGKIIVGSLAATGCTNSKCCHDTLVNTKPMYPNNYAEADYANLANKATAYAGWLQQASAKLKAVAGLP